VKEILPAAMLAMTITTVGAMEDQYTGNYMLPGFKKLVTEGDHLSYDQNIFLARVCAGIFYQMPLWTACPQDAPKGVTVLQEATIVIRYLDKRPQRWHELFVKLAAEALHDAWPCK
jgi:hypothetical protein